MARLIQKYEEDSNRKAKLFRAVMLIITPIIGIMCLSNIYRIIFCKSELHIISLSILVLIFIVSLLLLKVSGTSSWKSGSYVIITLLFIGANYGGYIWGMSMPTTLLSFIFIITIASTIVSSNFGIIVALLSTLSIMILGIHEIHHSEILLWRIKDTTNQDLLVYTFLILGISILSWISNKETEESLEKSRISEQNLEKEKLSLEQKVIERTKELKISQEEKITQIQRFSEFGKLASGIFHDLINPLNSVSLILEELKSGTKNMDEVERCVKSVLNASVKLKDLICASRKNIQINGMEEKFSVNSEIEQAISLLNYSAYQKDVNIKYKNTEYISLFGKKHRFHQIIINLISNSIDSINNTTDDKGKIHVESTDDGLNIIIKIRDNGTGIPDELKEKIFRPFFTTKNDAGLGLGLSMVKEIVEKDFKGKISFESSLGNGTVFTITIPSHGTKHPSEQFRIQKDIKKF